MLERRIHGLPKKTEARKMRPVILFLALLILFHPMLAFAQQTQPPPWPWAGPWHMWGGFVGFWWVFPLVMLLMMAGCITVFFIVFRLICGNRAWGTRHSMDRPPGGDRATSDPTSSALQILNDRFAKGEIQKQEYEEKRAIIVASGKP